MLIIVELYRVIHFINPIFTVPHIKEGSNDMRLLYPPDAISSGATYAANLYSGAQVINQDGQVVNNITSILIGTLPVMVGSVLDNARSLSDGEKLRRGMDPYDIDGYFIINGTKKIILIQEKLRLDMFTIYPADNAGHVVIKMTAETILGTSVNEIHYNDVKGVLLYRYGMDTKTDMINALLPFKLLGELVNNGKPLTGQQIFDFITPFIQPEHLHRVWLKLQNTFADLGDIYDPVRTLSDLKGMRNIQQWRKLKAQIERDGDSVEDIEDGSDEARLASAALAGLDLGTGKKRQTLIKNVATSTNMQVLNEEQKKELLQKDMLRVLFPQVDPDTNIQKVRIAKKLYMLGMMIARFGQYLAGVRKLDDRDDWGNKRLESAGRMMESLFRTVWSKMVFNLQENVNSHGKSQNIEAIVRNLDNQLMTKTFSTSFSSNRWGFRRTDGTTTVTDTLKEASLAEKASSLTKIQAQVAKEVKKPEVRMVDPSQSGYVCPVETPEGASCGLIKHTAITNNLSVDTGDDTVRRELKKFVSSSKSANYNTVCMLDGVLMGWCDGNLTAREMIAKRRKMELPIDMCVHHEVEFNELSFFTRGGRATRPLLVAEMGKDGLPVLVIERKKLYGSDFETLLREGAVEYIDALEQRNTYIAMSIQTFNSRRDEIEALKSERDNYVRYRSNINDQYIFNEYDDFMTRTKADFFSHTNEQAIEFLDEEIRIIGLAIDNLVRSSNYSHCELDPTAMMGISANLVPVPEHNQGPRNIYQTSMGKQALGIVSSTISQQMTNVKTLTYPTRPKFATQMSKWLGMDDVPAGQNIMIAFMTFPNNQEDAVLIDKGAADRGLFRYTVYHAFKSNNHTPSPGVNETFKRPPIPPGKAALYEAIDDNGLPKIGARVARGDCIIGKVRVSESNGGKEQNVSTFVPIGVEGIVDRVTVSVQGNTTNVNVKLRQTRIPARGDKVASRHAQKSTIGLVVPTADMPRTADGKVPSLIINPLAIPSRMTIGMLLELVASKAAVMYNEFVNATAFRGFARDGGALEEIQRMLMEFGYDDEGYEEMYSGTSGKPFPARIFTGPVYYQLLKHLAPYKIAGRGATGPVSLTTRQPLPGRLREGGLRFGEMERDSLLAHGAASLLLDFLCAHSDAHTDIYCTKCGTRALYRYQAEEYLCTNCNQNDQLGVYTSPYTLPLFTTYLSGFALKVRALFRTANNEEDL